MTVGETTPIMVRLSPNLKNRMKEQIEQGKFTTYADFCRSAIYEKLNGEEYIEKFHKMLIEDFDNPETR